MRGFTSRQTVPDVLKWLDATVRALPPIRLALSAAAGRVLAEPIRSPLDVPSFDRAMMDGFAVQAADTTGASAYNPLTLDVVGQALPGAPFEGQVRSGQAVRAMTGAPLPRGTDAVLPAEQVEISGSQVHALGDVAPGKHAGRRGEDIRVGTTVLTAGRRLRPQDVGLLSSIGVAEVPVVAAPSVRIVATGGELLPAGTPPAGYQIADANSPMLAALVRRDGGTVRDYGPVPDDPQLILAELRTEADVIVVSGGSSVGEEDFVPPLVRQHGELPIHGIAMRPSSPTGIGRLDGKLVFLLPGNPVSCLCAYDFFAGRAIRRLGGLPEQWPYRRIQATLRRKLVSVVGRVDYARVRIVNDGVEPLMVGGASILSSTTRADGVVIVPRDVEGFEAGTEVEVHLYG